MRLPDTTVLDGSGYETLCRALTLPAVGFGNTLVEGEGGGYQTLVGGAVRRQPGRLRLPPPPPPLARFNPFRGMASAGGTKRRGTAAPTSVARLVPLYECLVAPSAYHTRVW